mgnify:CR=1
MSSLIVTWQVKVKTKIERLQKDNLHLLNLYFAYYYISNDSLHS